tara:strand:+ start:181 stop:774 length:594 start_codon:yes stop_codon:yes gene_type:complete
MQFTESMIFIRENITTRWRDEEITIKQGWRSHREVNNQLGYSTGLIERCEANFGIYLWAPEFANVHGTFPYEERPIIVEGQTWPHSEGYFQAMKAHGTHMWDNTKKDIATVEPMDSWIIGQRLNGLRSNWNKIKDDIMMDAVRAKFQDPYLKALLISTGDYPLVQLKNCPHWGSGYGGKGRNMLGVLLQNLRDEIKN